MPWDMRADNGADAVVLRLLGAVVDGHVRDHATASGLKGLALAVVWLVGVLLVLR